MTFQTHEDAVDTDALADGVVALPEALLSGAAEVIAG